jgi:hypothetical protein
MTQWPGLILAKSPEVRHFGGRKFVLEAHGTKSECRARGKKFGRMGQDYRVIKKGNSYSLYVSTGVRVSNIDWHSGGPMPPMRRGAIER